MKNFLPKIFLAGLSSLILLQMSSSFVSAQTSKYVFLGSDGKLKYLQNSRGDTIPDFSNAGYKGGGVRIPTIPVVKTISPVSGDNTSHIQNAINDVGNMPLQSNGFRGALLLKKGTYNISGHLNINKSGIVLRGEGDSSSGTVLKGTGTGTRTLIWVEGKDDKVEISGTRQKISDDYVPVGARSFTVPDGSKFRVGDKVDIYRPTTQNWLDALGMDNCYTKTSSYDTSDVQHKTCLDPPWTTDLRKMYFDRIITEVSGNEITIDAPVTNSLDKEFGGGYIYKYNFPGRIENIGIENLRGDSTYTSSTDENHARRFIYFRNVQNAWIRDVTAIHFYHGVMMAWDQSKWITVQDSKTLDPVSQITGERRYPFDISRGQMILVQRCYSLKGRHAFVTGADTSGPNVFLDCTSENDYEDVGPHQRYATGTLYDNIKTDYALNFRQRNIYFPGNSHGWAGMQQVAWNCETKKHIVMSPDPKLGTNWSIGCIAQSREGNGIFDSYGTHVTPRSLYLAQLEERLGPEAVNNILKNPATITPTLTPKPTNTPTLTPSPTLAVNITPTRTPTPTIKPTSAVTKTPTPTLRITSTPVPTRTPTPTATVTPDPDNVILNFSAILNGIGTGGDSQNPGNATFSNKNPTTPTRNISVEIFSPNNEKVAEKTGIIVYTNNGIFHGAVDMGPQFQEGDYIVKIKSPKYLSAEFQQNITLSKGINNSPQINLVAGDINGDDSLSILDYNLLLGCYSDLRPASACSETQKNTTDLTDDSLVNQADYNLFLREFKFYQAH